MMGQKNEEMHSFILKKLSVFNPHGMNELVPSEVSLRIAETQRSFIR